MTASPREIGVGVVGFGTVGTGTVKLLLENAEHLRKRVGIPIRLVRVADQNTTRDRGVRLPEGVFLSDGMRVARDPDVQILVELVGGTGAAKDFLLEAIRNGKSVVTANKALLAECGPEIVKAVQAAGVDIGFEASVGGGIPIIRTLREGLAANRIRAIFGIINGTCNYILSRMTREGKPFAEVLAEAQAAGSRRRTRRSTSTGSTRRTSWRSSSGSPPAGTFPPRRSSSRGSGRSTRTTSPSRRSSGTRSNCWRSRRRTARGSRRGSTRR